METTRHSLFHLPGHARAYLAPGSHVRVRNAPSQAQSAKTSNLLEICLSESAERIKAKSISTIKLFLKLGVINIHDMNIKKMQ